MNPTIHIIEDDDAVRESLTVLMMARGLRVACYSSPVAFLAAAATGLAGCVVTDVQMPDMTGLELLQRLTDMGSQLPVVVMTGRAERGMAAEAVRRGAAAFLDKPFTAKELLGAVDGALAQA